MESSCCSFSGEFQHLLGFLGLQMPLPLAACLSFGKQQVFDSLMASAWVDGPLESLNAGKSFVVHGEG